MAPLVDAFWNAPSCFWSVIQCYKKTKTLEPPFSEPLPRESHQTVEIYMQGSGRRKTTYTIHWDFTSQHTISWKVPLCVLVDGMVTELKPGSCNLYTFPKVTWEKPQVTGKPNLFAIIRGAEAAAAKASEILEGRRLAVLNEVLLAITRDRREREILRLPDWSGANSVLGLLVSNTPAAIDICEQIFQQWPELMAQPHIVGTVNLFIGENLFHVLAANSQEKALVRLIQLAYERLDRDLLRQCFTSQATGPFFWEKPMNGYGGTPLGYACSFCMKVRHGPEMTLHSGLPSKQQCVLWPTASHCWLSMALHIFAYAVDLPLACPNSCVSSFSASSPYITQIGRGLQVPVHRENGQMPWLPRPERRVQRSLPADGLSSLACSRQCGFPQDVRLSVRVARYGLGF